MKAHSRRQFLRVIAAAASAAGLAHRVAAAPTVPPDTSRGDAMRGAEAMEDALALLASTGPEYAGGLSNHGPMAAEALVALGRADAVVPWVESYKSRLQPHPRSTRRIDPQEWREALGDPSRVTDWIAYFERACEAQPWTAVLAEWAPRLAPGVIAAAFHGVIRTAHAVRSLGLQDTPARRREFAEGLGYWAATYETLPDEPHRNAVRALPSQAIARVATLPADQRITGGNITHRLRPLASFPAFAAVTDEVDVSGDASLFLSDLTAAFAGVYCASVPPGSVITYIHTVTGPSAIRLLLPSLPLEAQRTLLRYAWQGAAALYAASGGRTLTQPPADPNASRDELIDRAIATGDEHAIKFTEACVREHALNPQPIYRTAMQQAVDRLG